MLLLKIRMPITFFVQYSIWAAPTANCFILYKIFIFFFSNCVMPNRAWYCTSWRNTYFGINEISKPCVRTYYIICYINDDQRYLCSSNKKTSKIHCKCDYQHIICISRKLIRNTTPILFKTYFWVHIPSCLRFVVDKVC